MTKVLYIACSPATGSTLLPFMLNTHPEICSISHTTGWPFGENETYHCSCGEVIQQCPFYLAIEAAFRDAGLPFEFRDFHMNYSLVGNSRLDGMLTRSLPAIRSSAVEKIRDAVVSHTPGFRRALARLDRANLLFFQTALEFNRASVFADGSQNPYRLRHLSRIDELDLRVVYLIRDVRGIALSRRNRDNWDAATATEVWIRDQMAIQRIVSEFPNHKRLYYEDLCDTPSETLMDLHQFMGLDPQPYAGDFKVGEHHMIGNAMRLGDGKIKKALRWKTELTKSDLDAINKTAQVFLDRNPQHPVAEIVRHYLFPQEQLEPETNLPG